MSKISFQYDPCRPITEGEKKLAYLERYEETIKLRKKIVDIYQYSDWQREAALKNVKEMEKMADDMERGLNKPLIIDREAANLSEVKHDLTMRHARHSPGIQDVINKENVNRLEREKEGINRNPGDFSTGDLFKGTRQ